MVSLQPFNTGNEASALGLQGASKDGEKNTGKANFRAIQLEEGGGNER